MRDITRHPPLAHKNSDFAPAGYQSTGVGVIPNDWSVSTVGNEFTIQLGKMLDAAKNIGTAKPYIGNRAVQWGRIDLDALATVAMSPSDLDRFRLRGEDLLVCEGGEIGRCAIWNDPIAECYYQKALHRLRSKRGYDVFLMMSLMQLWTSTGRLANYVTQTSIAHLPKDKFESVPLPVPSPNEQRVIAEALSDVEGWIDALTKLIAKKQDIKDAVMQQLLIGKTRLPGFRGEWVNRTLGEVADIKNGATPSTTAPSFWNGNIPWCTPSDITSAAGKYLHETERRITELGLSSCGASLLPRGSLLLCTRATIGEIKIASTEISTNQGFKSLICKRGIYNEFLYYLVLMLKPQIIERAIGSTFLEISKRELASIAIKIPRKNEQLAIANVLSNIDIELAALNQQWAKAKHIKQGMMQQLLTGRIRLVQRPRNAALSNAASTKAKTHNWAFNEAVVISILSKRFGTEQFPLGRKRYTKLSYLLHRHAERQTEGYLKEAAGPYNPRTKYGGPERIAIEGGYIREHKNGPYRGFVGAENIAQAEAYFEKWYGADCVKWLEQFRFIKNDELEVLATVDMAAEDLRAAGKRVDIDNVRDLIRDHPEWRAKLSRHAFSDVGIRKAIETAGKVFA